VQKNTKNNAVSNKRGANSNQSSAIKNKNKYDIEQSKFKMRKYSNGDDATDEDNFKSKTLRFTNNNFVGNANKEAKSSLLNTNTSNI
jgi:hypothetical protein